MFKNFKQKTSNRGVSLVEVLVAAAIILLVMTSLYAANVFYVKTILANLNKVKASFVAEEGIEAVKLIRDQNWTNISNLTAGSNYYLYWNGASWQATTTNTFVGGLFERKFSVASVNRDASDDIVTSGGTVDAGTRLLTVSVSWLNGTATATKSIATYITNFSI